MFNTHINTNTNTPALHTELDQKMSWSVERLDDALNEFDEFPPTNDYILSNTQHVDKSRHALLNGLRCAKNRTDSTAAGLNPMSSLSQVPNTTRVSANQK